MRKFLDGLYVTSGVAAAICILLICIIVSLQVVFNIITRARLFDVNLTIPSYTEISGFLFAAASFLALAYALTRGGHIRVTLILGILGERFRYAADLFSVLFCGLLSGATAYYMISLNMESFEFGDKSSGILSIPIWLVQLPLSIGLTILTIAFVDLFMQLIRTKQPLPESQPVE
jgi:TRAP-type C4-dicarboxylate transport system permease small subunit